MTELELLLTFLKIGTFTFGGGYAMLPLIQQEVIAHDWISDSALIDFIAVSESTPGPFAVNIATYVGSEVAGVPGAVCATLGVVLPSFVIILAVAKCFEAFKESRVVKGFMSGLKPAVVGMIGAAVLSVGTTVFLPDGASRDLLTDPATYLSLAVFAGALVLAFKKIHPIFIICLAAGCGIICGMIL